MGRNARWLCGGGSGYLRAGHVIAEARGLRCACTLDGRNEATDWPKAGRAGYASCDRLCCSLTASRGVTPDSHRYREQQRLQVMRRGEGSGLENKTKQIELLVETLTARGIESSTATSCDTDGSIARSGLNKVTSHSSVVFTGEDVDLLILLTAFTPPDRHVYLMKPGRGNIQDKVYSTRQSQELPFSGSILFIHSFTGCDTTRAIFN
ncbi:hypothetical protein PR048_024097 [Dryococelus australis]|uniref:Uncharacterized protein n=1 Tax=Dryococelus australis TaxID=614101 RepID=A0ABQ9GW10_9NEOP|nr:hypothetical protein PR048_024097 [Dryococelus australis]